MSITRATLERGRNWLLAAGLAAALGAAYATAIGGRGWVGAANGAAIGGFIAALELLYLGRVPGNLLCRRQGLLPYMAFTTLLWAVAIVATLQGTRYLLGHPWGALPDGHPHNTIAQDVIFAFSVGFVVSFASRLQGLIGTRTLFSFLIGRYARPVREDRTVLILDLAGSTALAEKLGALKVQALIGRFFYDISKPITEHGGNIEQYIGDAVVVTWPSKGPRACSKAMLCVFALHDLIDNRAQSYLAEFGTVPDFRAGLHCGPIIVSEIGDQRRAIALFGDTMNTTARLQELCKRLGHKVLASREIIARAEFPEGIRADDVGVITLVGKERPVHVYALARIGSACAGLRAAPEPAGSARGACPSP